MPAWWSSSVDYRKAPEHPAPAAVDDALAATAWLAEHGSEVGATGPVFVGGDSAGGNLSAWCRSPLGMGVSRRSPGNC
jgi:acetyl esterase/lipase